MCVLVAGHNRGRGLAGSGPYSTSCIVIPTLNEPAPLVIDLVTEIGGLAPGVEVIVVDDSPPEHAGAFAAAVEAALPAVSVIARRGSSMTGGGLGGAVLVGLRRAAESGCQYAIVMDADGQHPPQMLPAMFAGLNAGAGHDVVVASRYCAGGSAGAGLGAGRALVSRGSCVLARAVFPIAVGSCSDPMSGFFGVRLSTLDLDCWADGFKVLLQLLAQHPGLRRIEIGFEFLPRRDGVSKANVSEGARYLRGLAALRTITARRRGRRRGAAGGRLARARFEPSASEGPQ